jgi:acid phosphatase
MENHERNEVVGSGSAPYENALLSQGRDYTNYFGVTHHSLPDYLAFGNGSTDCKASDAVTAGEITATPTLWDQLTAARKSWGVYEEGMPSPCYAPYSAGSDPHKYVLKHNPATPFASVFDNAAACANVMPFAALDPAHLRAVSFITPDECDDAHSCPLTVGDSWLSAHVPALLGAGADVIITYDEGDTDLGVNGTSGGGNVYTVEVGPDAPAGSVASGQYNHYSLLAALEARFGLAKLNEAINAAVMPI